ncbi:MAG TPA: RdgB/HAM1 family non-canonical purine NTP pyrophosphatase [Candidatus Limnocylindria bacterium]|nr:RdgB/HAM1 family non-canonical purine NTP pyrophosphatase [Candidatus Limnocylindria bacterium]
MSRLLIATTNRGKQAELRRLLSDIPAEIVTPDELGMDLDVPEPFDTYAENAIAKADAYARVVGIPTLADDSGIEVAALDWGPGVRSARWHGGRTADALLEALEGVTDRRARMVCVVAVVDPNDGDGVRTYRGVVEGTIATERRGSGGFGYDPVFLLPSGATTAELPAEEKDRLSHRGRAIAAASDDLREVLAER